MTPPLPRRTLGKTGIEVSALGFGASPLGSVFGFQIDEDEGVAAVHEAVSLGVNFVDVSPFYGATKAESVLGRALAGLNRDDFVLATKVGRYGDTPADFDYTAARVTASVEESMKRLNVSHVDLIQCHDIEFVDLDVVWKETLPALCKLRAEGKVRAVGVTGLPFKALQYVLERAEPGSVDTVLSYCHSNMQNGELDESFVPWLQGKGLDLGLITASPLAMGLLTEQGPADWHPAPAAVKEACARAVGACKARGLSAPRLALQDSVRGTRAATTLVGMHTREVVRMNVEAAAEALAGPPSAEEQAALEEMRSILAPVRNASWPQGLAHNN